MTDFYNNVENPIWRKWGFGGIMSTIDERKNYLLNHKNSRKPPLISNVSVNNNIVETYVFNDDSVEFMYTTSEYNSKFQSLTMNDNGVNGDQISGMVCIL